MKSVLAVFSPSVLSKLSCTHCAKAIYGINSGTYCYCSDALIADVRDNIYGVEYFAQTCQICLLLPNESSGRCAIQRETHIS